HGRGVAVAHGDIPELERLVAVLVLAAVRGLVKLEGDLGVLGQAANPSVRDSGTEAGLRRAARLLNHAIVYHLCSKRLRSHTANEFIASTRASITSTPAAARTWNSSCGRCDQS